MKLRFQATFEASEYRKREILRSECLVILKHEPADMERIHKELYKIVAKNDADILAGKEPVKIDVIMDIAYRKRSPEANRLMWMIYTILSDKLNCENGTRDKIAPEDLYEQDMSDWAPRHEIFCKSESLEFFKLVLEREKGHVHSVTEKDGMCRIEVWQTSSYWNARQMCEHIDRLLNTLEQMGVIRENNGDLDKIMRDVEEWKAKKGGDVGTDENQEE
jgi:hypothetical protein